MPRRSGARGQPVDWIDGDFLAGQLRADAPAGVVELREVARRINAAVVAGEVTVSELARRAGVHRTSVQDVIAGRVWIDTHTLARLEGAAGRALWEHDPSGD